MSTLLWFYHIFTDLRRVADFWLLQSKLLWDGDYVYRLNHGSKNGHPMGEFSSSTLLLSGLILFKSISPCKHPIRSAQQWTYWISTDSRQCHITWYCRQLRHFANFATYWASPSHYSRSESIGREIIPRSPITQMHQQRQLLRNFQQPTLPPTWRPRGQLIQLAWLVFTILLSLGRASQHKKFIGASTDSPSPTLLS